MKITAVKTVVVNAEMRNWVFVKVETREPGLYGWGECSLEWKTRSVVGAVARTSLRWSSARIPPASSTCTRRCTASLSGVRE